ncbi:polysaccharide pyruvyl transferase family protein [Phascolarctobacterium faecium]|nr:polysaccharide pyruvyl transferase family protein [Phascolarctobacterium faecium]MDM8109656.1 polysaccharide pyruvyl transferase family protein [Phascolarctobacterium faecium]
MKVYIATFTRYENYGSRLQNFALCYAIKKLGAEPITLIVNSKKDILIKNVKKILSYFPIITKKQSVWISEIKKSRKNLDFTKKLNFFAINYDDLNNINFKNSIAIVGSDQVWSPVHLKKRPDDIELFFLRFVPQNKRFAYAPSFGVKEIPYDLVKMYKTYISDFNKVSVRENTGKNIIEEMVGINVPVLPDPTFLLNKNEWEKIAKKKLNIASKYILVYFLSEQPSAVMQKIKQYAKANKLEIIYIIGNIYHKNDFVPTPEEFIKLINSAEVVFTDSFHGCVFSIIMQTSFIVFERNDVEQFSRIDTLLKRYDLEKNIVKTNELWKIDFKNKITKEKFQLIAKLMEKEQQKGIDYLRNILNN